MKKISISSSSKVVILTGAGMSVESGHTTFRDYDGLLENHRVGDVAKG
jgi:NAD-dependent protein deacetylase/lipoamidase